jgi:hypothetical protein
LSAVEQSPDLQRRLTPVEGEGDLEHVEKFINVAARLGLAFNRDDLWAAFQTRAEQQMDFGELSEQDLERVAGGVDVTCWLFRSWKV